MKYILIVLMFLSLSGCVAMEQARADQMRSQADQAAAAAQAEQARTAAIIAEQNTAQLQVLAQAAKPVYWPIIVIVLVFAGMLLLIMRWQMITMSHVAAQTPMAADALRLLPSAVPYSRLRQIARQQGCELEASGDSYYLIENGQRKRITAVIEGNYHD